MVCLWRFSPHDLEVSTFVGFVLNFLIMWNHFKMYITINDIIGEKRIDLAYPIQGKEIAVISIFSDNVQYRKRKPVKVLLMTQKKELQVGTFTGRKLSVSLGEKLITTSLVAKVTSSRFMIKIFRGGRGDGWGRG